MAGTAAYSKAGHYRQCKFSVEGYIHRFLPNRLPDGFFMARLFNYFCCLATAGF